MTHEYFTDREFGPRPQNSEYINSDAWGGLKAAVKKRINDDSFASEFPIVCEEFDGGIIKTDVSSFWDALSAEVIDRETGSPIDMSNDSPSTFTILDMLEFCHRVAAAPTKVERRHNDYTAGFYTHDHVLRFDKQGGQEKFREEVNTIFARNGIAFQLTESGRVERTLPTVLGDLVRDATFQTGDNHLDKYLDRAKTKFLDPDPAMHREALEPLWDAWGRLKTIECPDKDKKKSIKRLLERASTCPCFRKHLDTDARELTDIGHWFMIRHSETNQKPLEESYHVDYLFYRMFALIRMLLVATGRM